MFLVRILFVICVFLVLPVHMLEKSFYQHSIDTLTVLRNIKTTENALGLRTNDEVYDLKV